MSSSSPTVMLPPRFCAAAVPARMAIRPAASAARSIARGNIAKFMAVPPDSGGASPLFLAGILAPDDWSL
jgi:hypothetical protein